MPQTLAISSTSHWMVHIAVIEDGKSDMLWNGVQTGNQRLSEQWNRPKGCTVSLYTYTNCDEVELLLNGRSLGRKVNPQDPKLRNQIRWSDIAYNPGTLVAVAFRNGKPVARHHLETSGKAVRLVATTDNSSWQADGMDLQHIRLTAVDAKGRRVLTATGELTFSIEGDARIVAVTNGDIASDELNTTNHLHLWQGSAMVILRAGHHPSKITLKTTSPVYKTLTTKIETK